MATIQEIREHLEVSYKSIVEDAIWKSEPPTDAICRTNSRSNYIHIPFPELGGEIAISVMFFVDTDKDTTEYHNPK